MRGVCPCLLENRTRSPELWSQRLELLHLSSGVGAAVQTACILRTENSFSIYMSLLWEMNTSLWWWIATSTCNISHVQIATSTCNIISHVQSATLSRVGIDNSNFQLQCQPYMQMKMLDHIVVIAWLPENMHVIHWRVGKTPFSGWSFLAVSCNIQHAAQQACLGTLKDMLKAVSVLLLSWTWINNYGI